MQPLARVVRLALAIALLVCGGFWLLGDGFGVHVPVADAILSMTSEAPFQVAPQPTPGSDATASIAVRPNPGPPPEIAVTIALVALVALVSLVGIALGARRARRGPAWPEP